MGDLGGARRDAQGAQRLPLGAAAGRLIPRPQNPRYIAPGRSRAAAVRILLAVVLDIGGPGSISSCSIITSAS
ncbi:hypothetical protein SCOCK_90158 [Actinacidiphila cocklensis]|uniref:Uncharacterized protein n=1 Tax=Actinacidiphila cocklensis TaxID=887465 RepID=A0A9W4GWL8_9ACTN|nr:hypothetical protein SCOCK_90158 [Actinacidiphila cocklensis]